MKRLSLCCEAKLIGETDLCSKCKEHTDFYIEYDCPYAVSENECNPPRRCYSYGHCRDNPVLADEPSEAFLKVINTGERSGMRPILELPAHFSTPSRPSRIELMNPDDVVSCEMITQLRAVKDAAEEYRNAKISEKFEKNPRDYWDRCDSALDKLFAALDEAGI